MRFLCDVRKQNRGLRIMMSAAGSDCNSNCIFVVSLINILTQSCCSIMSGRPVGTQWIINLSQICWICCFIGFIQQNNRGYYECCQYKAYREWEWDIVLHTFLTLFFFFFFEEWKERAVQHQSRPVCFSLREQERWRHISGWIRWINSRCCTQCVFFHRLIFPLHKTASCSRKWRSGSVLIKKNQPARCPQHLPSRHLPTSRWPLWPSFITSHFQGFFF